MYAVARACDLGRVSRRVSRTLLRYLSISHTHHKDCAGAILYSTDRAIEVAMEGMQCLGGNGYINGLCHHVPISVRASEKFIRVSDGSDITRREALRCWCGHPGNSADADWQRVQ